MATADTHGYGTPTSSFTTTQDRSAAIAGGGSLLGAALGFAVVVLAIAALVVTRLEPTLVGIAAIVFGVGMFFESGSIASRYARVLTTAPAQAGGADLGGGMTTEFAGGAATIVLGVLSLLNIYPSILLPITAIVVGAAILLGAASLAGLNTMAVEHSFSGTGQEVTRRVASAAAGAAAGAQVLVGIAAIVLGIIGVCNGYTALALVLTAVAFLCLGSTMIISGCAVGTKMFSMFHQEHRTL
ncbi:MAG TPA: hypothetical protein VFA18_23010 [Gemmataceae bacterium]|nr:hypothetical protein [Gemmataceae bacterium]